MAYFKELTRTSKIIKEPMESSFSKLKANCVRFAFETAAGLSVLFLAYTFFFQRFGVRLFKDDHVIEANGYVDSVLTIAIVALAKTIGGPSSRLIGEVIDRLTFDTFRFNFNILLGLWGRIGRNSDRMPSVGTIHEAVSLNPIALANNRVLATGQPIVAATEPIVAATGPMAAPQPIFASARPTVAASQPIPIPTPQTRRRSRSAGRSNAQTRPSTSTGRLIASSQAPESDVGAAALVPSAVDLADDNRFQNAQLSDGTTRRVPIAWAKKQRRLENQQTLRKFLEATGQVDDDSEEDGVEHFACMC